MFENYRTRTEAKYVTHYVNFTAFLLLLLLILSSCGMLSNSSDTDLEIPESAIEIVINPDFAAYSKEIPGSNVTIDMVPVQGGTFTMGRASGEVGKSPHEGPQRQVNIDSFWMTSHEISWEQYELFHMEVVEKEIAEEQLDRFGIEPDAIVTPSPPWGDKTFGMGHTGRPAVSMTHYAAVVYAMWLTAKTGEFHRLPTEAEWEYACRGGIFQNYNLHGDPSALDDHEWFRDNSENTYQRVASKKPNPLGLYDMKGNVAEWTMDEFHTDYHEILEGEVPGNPWFKPEVLYPRAVRGGSYRDPAGEIRCTHRRGSDGHWSRNDPQIPRSMWWHTDAPFVGFRLLRPKETPSREEMMEYWIMPIFDF